MKFPSCYFVMAALVAAPATAAAQTVAPPAVQQQDEHARDGKRGVRGEHGPRGERSFRGERGPRQGVRGRQGPGGTPLQRLIAQRQRLNLTDAQVQRLQTLERDLQARNAPVRQQLAALMPPRAERPQGAAGERRPERGARPQLTEEQRQQMRQRREQAQPLMQQLRQNTQAAVAEARGVLSADQQQQVRRLFEPRRDERGDRGPRGERRERGDRPRGGDSRSR